MAEEPLKKMIEGQQQVEELQDQFNQSISKRLDSLLERLELREKVGESNLRSFDIINSLLKDYDEQLTNIVEQSNKLAERSNNLVEQLNNLVKAIEMMAEANLEKTDIINSLVEDYAEQMKKLYPEQNKEEIISRILAKAEERKVSRLQKK